MSLKRIELELSSFTGVQGEAPSTATYNISKTIVSTHTKINFEVSELVRDYITHNFNNDYPSDVVWVKATANKYDEDDVPYSFDNPTTAYYEGLDGWGSYEDEANPQLSTAGLITANNIYLPENTTGKLPIWRAGVGKYIIDSTTTQVTADNGNTNQKIEYITIPVNSSTIKIYALDDTTLKKTITVTNVCEPKFTPYKVTFINKYGAYEDLYFYKKTIESFNVKDEEYKTNIINNSTAAYNTYSTQNQRYNINAESSLTMNTGFIVEDMTSTIEELFLSENVWIRYNGKTLPVLPQTKTMQKKTSLNDKLIDYTVNFKFAFNKINNVR